MKELIKQLEEEQLFFSNVILRCVTSLKKEDNEATRLHLIKHEAKAQQLNKTLKQIRNV